MEEITYKLHILEDNFRYLEVDTLNENNTQYLLLAQEENPSNICLRKIVTKENENQYYEKLNSQEFDEIYEKFIQKNKNLFE